MMKSRHSLGHATRLALGTLAALALLTAATACASTTPITSDEFVPGWQAHAKPMINMGMAFRLDKDKWRVPAILPPGRYVLVRRTGDKAEVIDGYQFEVRSGELSDTYLFLTPGQGDVEAVPLQDVPALQKRLGSRSMQ